MIRLFYYFKSDFKKNYFILLHLQIKLIQQKQSSVKSQSSYKNGKRSDG
jgi:hypothetical protein